MEIERDNYNKEEEKGFLFCNPIEPIVIAGTIGSKGDGCEEDALDASGDDTNGQTVEQIVGSSSAAFFFFSSGNEILGKIAGKINNDNGPNITVESKINPKWSSGLTLPFGGSSSGCFGCLMWW